MKNLLSFLLSCLSVSALVAQVSSTSRLQVLDATATETLLRLDLSGADRFEVSTPHGPAQVLSIEGGTPLLLKGTPDVPKFATALLIPNKGNMAVEIIATEYVDYPDVEVAPSKGNLKRTVDPNAVPYEYGPEYQRDAFFPGELAALQIPFVLRAARGQALWLYPVQYNPVQKVLRVYHSLTLRVHHLGGTGKNELAGGPVQAESRAFNQFYRRLFVNADVQVADRNGAQEPDKMLVIAKDDLLDELQPLITWKRQMGIHTTVVPVSEIGSSDASSIYNFIQNYYAEHQITYLLLAGDENAIKPEMRQDGEAYSCDNCFGYFIGDDHYPEVLVGRLHASTPEQMRLMVNRNLEYEKNPWIDSTANWFATGMASASNEGAGIGDDNQADWQHGNEWKSAHLLDGYEKYWEFYDGSHAGDSPTPGDESADQAGNPANTPLVDLMNTRGVSLYNYTGHGWEQGLVSGNFNTTAVANLRNHHRYPIIIAVACCAGNFTNGECLGETWQRAGNNATGEPWGGIAGFFSSDYQSWSPPMEGQDGMNQYLTDADGIQLRPSLSGMLAYGNAKMMAAYGSNGEMMADFWNPFAEPTTMPRTRSPLPIIALHPDSTAFEANTLIVNCPVEGALVSLFWQDQTRAVAIVENGVATLEYSNLTAAGDFTLTVSQFNYLPYQGIVHIKPAVLPFVTTESFDLDDAAGNNNKKADFGESAVLNAHVRNIGLGTATAVKATLSTDDPFVTLTSSQITVGDLDGNAASTAAFPLVISDEAPNGHKAAFTLTLQYSDSLSISSTTTLVINAPSIEITGWTFDDSAGGNGNGRLESGETAILQLDNRNTGASNSPDAQGILTTSSPYLILSGPVSLGSLPAAGASATAAFQVKVTSDAPASALAALHYEVVAGHYGAEEDIAPLLLNAIIENFEANNFSSFNWDLAGNKPWTITTIGAYNGKYCARSGTITHNQKSTMRLSLQVSEAGIVSFARRVNSESGFDFLRFYIDSVEVGAWSGVVPWGEVSFPVTAGLHTLTWSYEKDDLTSSGSDRAWVDEILLPPHQIVVGTSAPENSGLFGMHILPNPTSGIALLHLEIPEGGQSLDIRLYDFTGKLLQTVLPPTRQNAGPQQHKIDLSNYQSGIYFVRAAGEKGAEKKLLIKI